MSNLTVQQPRRPVTSTELADFIRDIVAAWVVAKKEFTAWDVTQEMKAQHNDIEFRHGDDVRLLVQAMMSNVADYTSEWRFYGLNAASTYVPVPSVTISVTGTPVAPASVTPPAQPQLPAPGIIVNLDDL